MPRPIKWRKVCCLPASNKFGPLDLPTEASSCVNMTVDEYETIRLIDLKGFTQEDIIEALNGLPENKVHCSNLGVSALRNAINNYLGKRMEDSYENSNSCR